MTDQTIAAPAPGTAAQPKLLDRVKRCIRDRHYSLRTEEAYVYWIRWYIRFHGIRHPAQMGAEEIKSFLSYLTNERRVSVSTHKQALCALVFLYKNVLETAFPQLDEIYRPRRPPRLPAVLSRSEVSSIISLLSGVHALMTQLLYGTGMRLMECLTLRVQDIDFDRNEITIRSGKGGKDRVTLLPVKLVAALKQQIASARRVYEDDRAAGRSGVMLPGALEAKSSRIGKQWPWF